MHLPPETNMPTKPQENHNQQQKQKQKKNSTFLHAHVYLCSFISNVLLSRLKSSRWLKIIVMTLHSKFMIWDV